MKVGSSVAIAQCMDLTHRRNLKTSAFHLLTLSVLVGIAACQSLDDDEGSWGSTGTTRGSGSGSASSDAGVAPNVNVEPNRSDVAGKPTTVPPALPVRTNPFVLAAHDPFSTFAIDVDTASYDIFRRDVNLNRLPQQSQVRLEEFVNAFAYDYPTPSAASPTPFAVGVAAAVSPFASGTTLLRVNVQGKAVAAQEKKPTNLVYLIDVSGSMNSSDKLGLVKQVVRQSLDLLAPNDKVSIVTYAGNTAVRLPPTPASEKAAVRRIVDSLAADGGTAGGSGIMLAYEQAQGAFIPDGINHVLLCTDGDFNLGISNTNDLVRLIENKRRTGITLTALGFGSDNLNDEMMERVSNAGNGIYAVISSEAQAATYVRDSLLSTIVHIAKDVKVQVEFNPALVTAYRLLGYENRDIADVNFRNDLVDAGEIGAGLRVTALYELTLAGATVPAPAGAPAPLSGAPVSGLREILASDLAMVKVRYKAPGAMETDPASEVAGHLTKDAVVQSLAAADMDLQWAAAVGAFAEILRGSPFANRAALPQIEAVVEAQKGRDAGRAEFAGLFAKAKLMLPN